MLAHEADHLAIEDPAIVEVRMEPEEAVPGEAVLGVEDQQEEVGG